jgi:hypothetical protein
MKTGCLNLNAYAFQKFFGVFGAYEYFSKASIEFCAFKTTDLKGKKLDCKRNLGF